jgi:hypothetical protein
VSHLHRSLVGLILLPLLLAPSRADAALAVSQCNSGNGTSASLAVTLSGGVSANDLLVAAARFPVASAYTSITDGVSSSYTKTIDEANTGAARQVIAWAIAGGTSASVTLTLTIDTTGLINMTVCRITGAATSTPLTGTAISSQVDGATSNDAGTLTPAVSDAILFSADGTGGAAGTFTQPTSYTVAGSCQARMCAAYRIVSSISGYTANWSTTNSVDHSTGLVAFKSATAAAVKPKLTLLGVGEPQ